MWELDGTAAELGQLREAQWELSQYASARGARRTTSLSWDQLAVSSTQLGRVFMSGTVGAVTRMVMVVWLDGAATIWTVS